MSLVNSMNLGTGLCHSSNLKSGYLSEFWNCLTFLETSSFRECHAHFIRLNVTTALMTRASCRCSDDRGNLWTAVFRRRLRMGRSNALSRLIVGHVKKLGVGGGVIQISSDLHYDGAWSNVISVTRGCVDVKFAEKKALHNTWMAPECPPCLLTLYAISVADSSKF